MENIDYKNYIVFVLPYIELAEEEISSNYEPLFLLTVNNSITKEDLFSIIVPFDIIINYELEIVKELIEKEIMEDK